MRDRYQSGFTYIGVMIFVSLLGVGLSGVGQIWAQVVKREREQELLFIGNQFRTAINQFNKNSPGTDRNINSLQDLLRDPRYPGAVRYLRKMYLDPITGSTDWGVVVNQNGSITGVYSLSEDTPFKKHNFSAVNQSFEGKNKYSEWVFMSQPPVASTPAPFSNTGMPASMLLPPVRK